MQGSLLRFGVRVCTNLLFCRGPRGSAVPRLAHCRGARLWSEPLPPEGAIKPQLVYIRHCATHVPANTSQHHVAICVQANTIRDHVLVYVSTNNLQVGTRGQRQRHITRKDGSISVPATRQHHEQVLVSTNNPQVGAV